ncbi:sensor histidine kinase [Salinifilum aidingensis]
MLRTLRGRLVLSVLGVTVVGLVVAGFASVGLLERSLVARVDEQLINMSRPWEEGRGEPPPPPRPPAAEHELPTDFRVLFFDSGGRLTGMTGQSASDRTGPDLQRPTGPGITTVPGRTGESGWRVRTLDVPGGRTIALALSLRTAEQTVHQLIIIELVVGGGVLLVLAIAAATVIRIGLRPLTRIERTADAIAAGDHDRRVQDQDPRTETGRLGNALNAMLEQLVDALQQREKSEQRLRRFVADASHELRTPLTSIRGFAELHRRSEPGPDDARQMMSRIEHQAQRMSDLVEDLLLLARLDRERSLELAELDLLGVARDAADDARARDPERAVDVDAEGSVRVLGDGGRVRQIATNLVTNALVHTAPGTPVRLAVRQGAADPSALAAAGADLAAGEPMGVLEVADSGPGIPPEEAGRVFDRFYRVDPGRPGSTGLGLAITAALVEAHSGRVELHGGEHGGSVFRLLLPLP